MEGWIKESHNYTPARTPITVKSVSDGGMVAIVVINRGREKRIYTHGLDCGREFRTRRGEWIPENDPRVRVWLTKALRDIRAGGKKACKSDDLLARADAVRDLEWVMRRNKWEVPR